MKKVIILAVLVLVLLILTTNIAFAGSSLTGDVNGDGRVNVLDMIKVGQHWDETGTVGWIPEDVRQDGVINVLDIILVGQNWTG